MIDIERLDFIEHPEESLETFGKDELYIMTADLEQNETKEITKFDGDKVTLYTPQKYNANYRTALPKVGKIVKAVGVDCKFKEGDTLLCTHFTFVNENRQSTHFTEVNGVKYYRVTNMDIIACISGGTLIPQDEVVLCEPVVGKLIETDLELQDDLIDMRRDVAKIAIVPEKYKEALKVGHYLFLDEGGDYIFEVFGKTYIAVELFLNSAAMHGPELDYKPAVLWRHKEDHNKETDITE